MENYIHTFELSLTYEQYESRYNNQSYMAAKAVIDSFKETFPGATVGVTRSRPVQIEGGLKFIVDINSDVTPLEMAAKQVEIYTNI